MNELLEAAKAVIDATDTGDRWCAIANLRAAVERAEKQEVEPVAWGVMIRGERVWYVNDSRFTCQGYANHYAHRDAKGLDQLVIPLYAHPPRPTRLDQLLERIRFLEQ